MTQWTLQKKLLGFRVMDYSHTAHNIFQVIMSVIQDYGIHNRIMSITLDNASANSKAIEYFINSNIHNIAGNFFHARCACHIINLIVKSGFKKVESQIVIIREALGWIMASNQRSAEFARFCKSNNLKPRKFQTDMPVRWNSTYLMLKSALPYGLEITSFYNLNTINNTRHEKLTEGDWYVVKVFVEFLTVFYDATVELSGVYYPTSPLALHKLYDIADLLKQYREIELVAPVVVAMQEKYKKYWGKIPLLYAFGIVVDPRFRFKALKVFSATLGEALGLSETDVAEHLGTLKSQILEVFSIYENMYRHNDDTTGPTPPQQQSQQQSKLMRIFLNKTTTSRASRSSSQSQSQHVELNKYLSTEYSITDNDDFTINDLLKWWQNKRNTFPILSRLACDVLAIPVSTVSSEQVFSTAG
ncbi:hypothetical protein Ddye_001951 [Dipteronia dyeriana]|uniref:Transposase n=1 Tax=Dipteronia dyeriana TaxID=168575 RepID=A0AAD9XQL3_9ROSI|nr:hypothetical protein Ddye_001951 [Dipteronia dyeriana]